MRDFPPDSLIARMIELRLCTPRDLQRAAGRVRKMTRDLPAFDSLWVDALVQAKVLTPFQSRWLETHLPETLLTGPYVLLDGLSADADWPTFLARGPRGRVFALKHIRLAESELPAVELRLQLLMERARNCQAAGFAAAMELLPTSTGLFVVSPYVKGLDLSQMLVRRGRFPADVVLILLDQLLAALAAWHAAAAVHGDLRLSKIRLTERGQIVLVDGGVRTAVQPDLLVHRVQTPDEADVVAPERIGSNQPVTAATDLYAAGCIGWQLLAGRAPHLTADPLAKLAAHQTRRIPDVRELAPDTPAELAEAIFALTAPDPQQRPTSAEAARRLLGRRSSVSRQRLIRFRKEFDSTVPHLSTRKSSRTNLSRWLTPVMVLLGICLYVLSHQGMRSELLTIAQKRWTGQVPSADELDPEPDVNVPRGAESTRRRIPEPNAQGVIVLTEPGPYEPRSLSGSGSIVIQAGKRIRPKVVVSTESWPISAERVVLKGIDIETKSPVGDFSVSALLEVKSQALGVVDCRWFGPSAAAHDEQDLSAIRWEAIDRRDPQSGQFEWQRVHAQGAMHLLDCRSAPREVNFRHVLKTGPGSLLLVEQTTTHHGLKVNLEHLTLRDTGPLLSCAGPLVEHRSASLIEIDAVNSAFAIHSSASLLELRGPSVRPDWAEAVRISGDGSLIAPNTTLLSHHDFESQLSSVLESDQQQVDGLMVDEFEFAGELSDDPRGSTLIKTRAPRRPGAPLPGIKPDLLP